MLRPASIGQFHHEPLQKLQCRDKRSKLLPVLRRAFALQTTEGGIQLAGAVYPDGPGAALAFLGEVTPFWQTCCLHPPDEKGALGFSDHLALYLSFGLCGPPS